MSLTPVAALPRTKTPKDEVRQIQQQTEQLILKIAIASHAVLTEDTDLQDKKYIRAQFISKHRVESDCNAHKEQIEKINTAVLKQLATMQTNIPLTVFADAKSYCIPRSEMETLVRELESMKGYQSLSYVRSPKKNPIEDKNGEEFVRAFNSDTPNLEINRYVAFKKLDHLHKQVWNFHNGVPSSPKKGLVSRTRLAIFELYSCEDPFIKEKSLNMLSDLLSNDPLDEDSANNLVKLQKQLLEEIKANKAQDLNTRLQRLLIKSYALTIECILLHFGSQHLNALTDETKMQIWSGAEELSSLNVLKDREISFWVHYAIQGAQHIRSNVSDIEKLLVRIAQVTRAGVRLWGIYNGSDLLDEAFNDLKNAVSKIEWHEKWFEGLLYTKKLLRFSMDDSETFRQVAQVIQKKKKENADPHMFYGIAAALETVILCSHSQEIQEEAIKMLLQIARSSKYQFKVISVLHQLTKAGGRLANTAIVILKLLRSCSQVHCEESRKILDDTIQSISTAPLPRSVKFSQDQPIKEQVYFNVIKFLIRRIGDVKEGSDYGGQSLVTLLATSEDPSLPKILTTLKTISEDFIGPDALGNTGCHIATKEGNVYAIRELHKTLDIDLNAQNFINKNTALHEAALNEEIDACVALIELGADPNLINRDGDTPLHLAVRSGFEPVIDYLLMVAKAKPSKVNLAGEAPLNIAIKKNAIQLVDSLTKANAQIAEHVHQLTPIVVAARCKSEASLQHLIQKNTLPLTRLECFEILRLISDNGVTITCNDVFCWYHLNKLKQDKSYAASFEQFKEWAQLSADDKNQLTLEPIKPNILQASVEGASKKRLSMKIRPDQLGETALIGFAKNPKLIDQLKFIIKEKGEINKPNFFGITPLHAAVLFHNLEGIKELLQAGANVNQADMRGYTALHFAVFNRDIESVKLLLASKADPHAKNDYGDTPLLLYCGTSASRNPESVKYMPITFMLDDGAIFIALKNAGAKITVRDMLGNNALHHAFIYGTPQQLHLILKEVPDLFWKKNHQGLIPIQEGVLYNPRNVANWLEKVNKEKIIEMHRLFLESTHKAVSLGGLLVKANDIDLFKVLLAADPTIGYFGESTDQMMTPLHYAAIDDLTDFLKLYLDSNLETEKPDQFGDTPAHYAACHKSEKFLQRLIASKANLLVRNRDGRTPLHQAAFHGHLECVKLLLKVPGIASIKDGNGDTALHLAAKRGHLDSVQVLAEKISQYKEDENNDENTPLHLAAMAGHKPIVEWLKGKGADLEPKNRYGATPLMLAAQEGKTEAVQALIDSKVNLHIQDVDGETALNKAVYGRHWEIVNLLLMKEKDLSLPQDKRLVYMTNGKGETPLFELIKRKPRKQQEIANGLRILRILLENGSSLIHTSSNGENFVHQVCYHGHTDLLRHIIDMTNGRPYKIKYDFAILDGSGNSLMHKAVFGNCEPVLNMLPDQKIMLEWRNKEGLTPLQLALKLGNVKIAIVLTNWKSDLQVVDKEGRSLLHLLLDRDELTGDMLHYLSGLVANNPSLIKKEDNHKATPLHYAAKRNHIQCLDILLKNLSGSEKNRVDYLWKRNSQGNTAVEIAAGLKHKEFALSVQNYSKSDLGKDFDSRRGK